VFQQMGHLEAKRSRIAAGRHESKQPEMRGVSGHIEWLQSNYPVTGAQANNSGCASPPGGLDSE
jgi:hypothetical protein